MQKNVQNFVGFLEDGRAWYFPFDIYRPLTKRKTQKFLTQKRFHSTLPYTLNSVICHYGIVLFLRSEIPKFPLTIISTLCELSNWYCNEFLLWVKSWKELNQAYWKFTKTYIVKKNSPKTYTVKENFTKTCTVKSLFAQKHKKDTRTMKRSDGVSS